MWTMWEKKLFNLWLYKYCYDLNYRSPPENFWNSEWSLNMWFRKSSLLKCKVCGEVPYVGKAKIKFPDKFNNYKSKHSAFRKGNWKVPQKLFHTHYFLDGHWRLGFCNFWAMQNTCTTEGKRNILAT